MGKYDAENNLVRHFVFTVFIREQVTHNKEDYLSSPIESAALQNWCRQVADEYMFQEEVTYPLRPDGSIGKNRHFQGRLTLKADGPKNVNQL